MGKPDLYQCAAIPPLAAGCMVDSLTASVSEEVDPVLHPQALPPVPDATAAAVEAAFPHGNLYVDLRAEFGTLYDDQIFADLYPPSGRPVAIPP